MKNLPSLSIFFPVYNDQFSISELIKDADTTAKAITRDYELIVVNDGSTDRTITILNKLKKTYKNLTVINHKKNKGYGGALISGFNACSKEWIFYTDGDGQYNVKELLLLVSNLNISTDIVNGYKIERKDPLLRKLIGKLYNKILHFLYPLPINDIDCDFRLIRTSLLRSISLNSYSGTICLELILKLHKKGARFTEIGVTHYKRKYGVSQFFKIENLLKTFLDHLKFYINWNIRR